MLFKQAVLDRIAAGEVRLAFRRWRRPTVKAGGRLRTPVGVLAIDAVDRVAARAITDSEAQSAGFASAAEVRAELGDANGDVYRIAFRLAGPDPREALRRRGRLSTDERAELATAIAGLDRKKPWVLAVLKLIGRQPGKAASRLAAARKQETAAFKRDVRKLKELGLTESLDIGYRLSPRGRAVLALIGKMPTSRSR